MTRSRRTTRRRRRYEMRVISTGIIGAATSSRMSSMSTSRAAGRYLRRVPPGGTGRRSRKLGAELRCLHAVEHHGAQRLLEASRDSNIERFIFASSSSVYGDAESLPTTENQMLRPLSPYGATKALGEHLTYLYFRNYGIPTIDLRFFSVYGPRQRPDMAFHRAIEAGLSEERSDYSETGSDAGLHVRRGHRGWGPRLSRGPSRKRL